MKGGLPLVPGKASVFLYASLLLPKKEAASLFLGFLLQFWEHREKEKGIWGATLILPRGLITSARCSSLAFWIF